MSDGPLARWRALRKKSRERFFERSLERFKGKVFEVILERRTGIPYLQSYDKEKGLVLSWDRYRHLTAVHWIDTAGPPVGEHVLATGKVVVAVTKTGKSIVVGFEVLTSKGVGYLASAHLLGPLEKNKDGRIRPTTYID